jgi:hypothetical protein
MRRLGAIVIAMALGGCAAMGDVGSGVPAVPAAGSGAARVVVGGGGYSAVTPNQMRVEAEVGTRGNRSVLGGYVYNTWVMPARDVILLVEGLDPSGAVTARTRAYVNRMVMPSDRSYWEVALPVPASLSYRVNVASVQWIAHDR